MNKKYVIIASSLINLLGGVIFILSTLSFELFYKLSDAIDVFALLEVVVAVLIFVSKLNIICAGLSGLAGFIVYLTLDGNLRLISGIVLLASFAVMLKNYKDVIKEINIDNINEAGKKLSKVVSDNIEMNHNMVVCPKCGEMYAKSGNFCPVCGADKPKESGKKRCVKCNAELDANTMFCPHCGEKVQEENKKTERVCKNCGTPLKDDTVFCGNCGTKVGD